MPNERNMTPAPAAVAVPDDFRGDTASLVRNILALLELDAAGALVPHGVGGHARGLLSAAAARLAVAPAQASRGITIDFKQATELLAMFGGEPAEVALITGDGHSGNGLYASYTDMPEEGAEFLGTSDNEAAPAATAQEHAAQVLAMGRVPPGCVAVERKILEDASESLGNFVSDHGWGDSDIAAADNLSAVLAGVPRPPAAQELKPLTDEQIDAGHKALGLEKFLETFRAGVEFAQKYHGITQPTGD